MLYHCRLMDSLAVFNLKKYFLAAQIVLFVSLHATHELPIWTHFIIAVCSPLPIYNVIWLPPPQKPQITEPSVLQTLRQWDLVKYSGNLISTHLSRLGILNNPSFTFTSKHPLAFRWWQMKRIKHISDRLIINGISMV